DFPQPFPPFPEAGTDPTPDSLGCPGYIVVPPGQASGSVRIGAVMGSPGETVETPVYLTNSEEVEGFQLVICYDSSIVRPVIGAFDNDAHLVKFEGTFYEGMDWPKLWRGFNMLSQSTMVLGFMCRMTGQAADGIPRLYGYNIPPGSDRPILKIRWMIQSGAPANALVSPRLTNGPDG